MAPAEASSSLPGPSHCPLPDLLASNLPPFGPLAQLAHAPTRELSILALFSSRGCPQGPQDRIQASEPSISGPNTFQQTPLRRHTTSPEREPTPSCPSHLQNPSPNACFPGRSRALEAASLGSNTSSNNLLAFLTSEKGLPLTVPQFLRNRMVMRA